MKKNRNESIKYFLLLTLTIPLLVCLTGPSRADDCPSTLNKKVLIRESDAEPLREPIKIPRDWERQARIDIDLQVPDFNMVNALVEVATSKNSRGDAVDKRHVAIDLLFDMARYDDYAGGKNRDLLARLSDVELHSYVLAKLGYYGSRH